jgi:hypothetical protein
MRAAQCETVSRLQPLRDFVSPSSAPANPGHGFERLVIPANGRNLLWDGALHRTHEPMPEAEIPRSEYREGWGNLIGGGAKVGQPAIRLLFRKPNRRGSSLEAVVRSNFKKINGYSWWR